LNERGNGGSPDSVSLEERRRSISSDSAKTITDCFKYRNKIGLDVALETLRDYRQKYRGGMDKLYRFAKICRVERVIRPYLEALE
jgi:hypothetical protein